MEDDFMSVPVYVPTVVGRHVLNQTIVYSDTVPDLKEKGEKLKLKGVQVGDENLEECIRIILTDNPDVTFNTIQYSKACGWVYFYTDSEIDVTSWENRNEIIIKHYGDSNAMIRYIDALLNTDDLMQPECISIYEVQKFLSFVNDEGREFKQRIEDEIKRKVKGEFPIYGASIWGMDSGSLRIDFYFKNGSQSLFFNKKGNDIYISKQSGRYVLGMGILAEIGEEISAIYDYLLESEDINNAHIKTMESVNSKFCVSIYLGVGISESFYELPLVQTYSFSDKIVYRCNSTTCMNYLQKNVYKIYKKIFVRIDDCPEWMRDRLYRIRQEQLVEAEKIRKKQLKKEKRRDTLRKAFPFLKK